MLAVAGNGQAFAVGELGSLASNAGIMGILVWNLWYHVKVVQPRHEKAMKDMSMAFNETMSLSIRTCESRKRSDDE